MPLSARLRSTLHFLLSPQHPRLPHHLVSFFPASWASLQGAPPIPFTFETLHVYQKAVDFTDTICGLTERFPRGYGFLVDQRNWASLSVAANIAEGNGRLTKADEKNFFGIARGSAQECVPLLELARRRGLIEDADHGDLLERLDEIARMLSGLFKGTENRAV